MRKKQRFTEADLAVLQAKVQQQPAKAPKYGNRKSEYAGIKFDSEREKKRWLQLCLLERAGEIADLERQVDFELAPGVDLGEGRRKPALRYRADAVYRVVATGERVVEDSKGAQTDVYRIKKHLMATVHGIVIKEV
jgi:hypothetical protein